MRYKRRFSASVLMATLLVAFNFQSVRAQDRQMDGVQLTGPASLTLASSPPNVASTATVVASVPMPPAQNPFPGAGFRFIWPAADKEFNEIFVEKYDAANNTWVAAPEGSKVSFTAGTNWSALILPDADNKGEMSTVLTASFPEVGQYQVRFKVRGKWWPGTAADYVGTSEFLTLKMAVVTDTTKPLVAITKPIGNQSYGYEGLPRVEGTSSDDEDGVGIDRVKSLLRREPSERAPAGYYNGNGSWAGNNETYRDTTLSQDGTWKQDLPTLSQGFAPGTYIAKAVAVDKAENRSDPFGVVFTINVPTDTSKPTLTISKPIVNSTYSPAGLPQATGAVDDGLAGSGIEKVAVLLHREGSGYYNGTNWNGDANNYHDAILNATSLTKGTWSFSIPQAGLVAGTYYIKVLAIDKEGNTQYAGSNKFILTEPTGGAATVKRASDWVNAPDDWDLFCDQEHSDRTDCGNFVGEVIQATSDHSYPEQGTSVQYEYVTTSNKWTTGPIGQGGPQPGDVLLITAGQRGGDSKYGHTGIYAGLVNGKCKTYEASLGGHGPMAKYYDDINDLNGTFRTWARPN